jgi:nucleotide-binding universal stress UspA family protein
MPIRHAGQRIARNVVVATSLAPEAAIAVKWAAQHLCRKNDGLHLVHVARCLSTPSEVSLLGGRPA